MCQRFPRNAECLKFKQAKIQSKKGRRKKKGVRIIKLLWNEKLKDYVLEVLHWGPEGKGYRYIWYYKINESSG